MSYSLATIMLLQLAICYLQADGEVEVIYMKIDKKRAFTIVELVIVIALISILAAVLVPTFSAVIREAKDSYIMQNDRNKLLQNFIESTLDGEEYTTAEIESETAPKNVKEMIEEDFTKMFDRMLEIAYSKSQYVSEYGCIVSGIDFRDRQHWKGFKTDGFSRWTTYRFMEKYIISYDTEGDVISSMRIRLYDDIDPSSGESVYYGLKAVRVGEETTTTADGKQVPKYTIEVVKITEPQG